MYACACMCMCGQLRQLYARQGVFVCIVFMLQYWLSNTSVSPGIVHHFEVNIANRKCVARKVDKASVEFPTTHPYRHGHNGGRFSYLMASDREGYNLPYRDVVKVCVCVPTFALEQK